MSINGFRAIVSAILLLMIVYFAGDALLIGTRGESFGDDFSDLLGNFWGRVIFFDLYIGLLVIAAWIFWRSSSKLAGALWGASMFVGGNPVLLAYLLWTTRKYTDPVDWRTVLLGRETQ